MIINVEKKEQNKQLQYFIDKKLILLQPFHQQIF